MIEALAAPGHERTLITARCRHSKLLAVCIQYALYSIQYAAGRSEAVLSY